MKIKQFNRYNFWIYFVHPTCLFYVERASGFKEGSYNKVNSKYGDYHYELIKHMGNRHPFFVFGLLNNLTFLDEPFLCCPIIFGPQSLFFLSNLEKTNLNFSYLTNQATGIPQKNYEYNGVSLLV